VVENTGKVSRLGDSREASRARPGCRLMAGTLERTWWQSYSSGSSQVPKSKSLITKLFG